MEITFRKIIEFNGQRIEKEATVRTEKGEPFDTEVLQVAINFANFSKEAQPVPSL